MKKFFPDRKHVSILTYLVIAFTIFLTFTQTTSAADGDCRLLSKSSSTINLGEEACLNVGTRGDGDDYACPDWQSCQALRANPPAASNYIPVTVCSYSGDETACTACLDGGGENGGIWTALGCIHYDQDKFIFELVKIIMGVVGFISLAMMLVGSVIYMTGGGNPEQLKRGKELFTGAIVGLLFLIFSVVILQIITKDIIKIDL